MAGYYRLKELGFSLAAGAHVLPKDAVEPLAAATALVDEAHRSAEQIVADAREAYEAEKRRGYEEGLALAKLEAARMLLAETDLLDRKLAGAEAELTDVVVTAVRRLVQGFSDREKAEILVRAALKQMRREKKAELRVSHEQYFELRESITGILQEFPEVELVDVVEDPTLVAPQVIVETSIGRVEGDIGRHLDELEAIVTGTIRSAAQSDSEVVA
jgi:type III secretion protein L